MKDHFSMFFPMVPCLALGITILSGQLTFSAEANDTPKRIVCHYLSMPFEIVKHPFNYQAKDIPKELCTDIIYAFLRFDSETWELKNTHYHKGTDLLRQFTLIRTGSLSSSGPNLFLSVGDEMDDNEKWSTMVADASKRLSFVTSALRLIKDYGFNGLDLFWNSQEAGDRENFVKLVEEIVDAFKPFGLLLTFSIPIDDIVRDYINSTTIYDIQRLSELVDWMNVLTSNLRGPWNDFVDVISPLYRRPFDGRELQYYNVHDGLEIMVRLGAPRRKLILSISFFGYSYTLLSSSATYLSAPVNESANGGTPGPVMESPLILTYFEICRMLSSGKWTRQFDHFGICPYAFYGNQWVGYEDEQGIRIKMNYVKDRGLGGAHVIYLNFDDFNGFCGSKHALLHAVHEELTRRDQQNVDSNEFRLKKRYEAMGIISPCLNAI